MKLAKPVSLGLLLIVVLIALTACTLVEKDDKLQADQPVKRSSSAIAITLTGDMLLVVNPDSNSLSLVNTENLNLIEEISVGRDPRTVSLDDLGRWALTANRAAGTTSIVDLKEHVVVAEIEVGHLPWGVVVSPDGTKAYVACEESAHIAVIDISKKAVISVISVEDRPNGLAMSSSGDSLFVTHLLNGRVSVIDTAEAEVIDVFDTWPDANLSQSIVFHPEGTRAYLPQTRSNSTNDALTFDTTVFPLVTVLDVSSGDLLSGSTISLPESDTPVGLPYDAAFSPDANTLYIVNAASNDVSVIDLATLLADAHIEVEDNPRGIVVSPDGKYVYINNILAGTVSVIDTETNVVTANVPVTQIPLPPVLLRGKQVFHSSNTPELSLEQWISCNTCHWEGEHDGRTWIFGFSGPRNTTSLLGMIQTYPLRWSGEWDESADSEFVVRKENFGMGLVDGDVNCSLSPLDCINQPPNQGRSYDLDCLAAFIDSLTLLPNSHVNEHEYESVRRGGEIFNDPLIGCVECHPPPYYTDFKIHDVGTAYGQNERLGAEIDTPTLLGLYRSEPYFHDGSAASLYDSLTRPSDGSEHDVSAMLSEAEILALIDFILTLP